MSQPSTPDQVLAGWDPRRRTALEQVWEQFARAGANGVSLSEELIAERRAEAAAEATTPANPATRDAAADAGGQAPRRDDAR